MPIVFISTNTVNGRKYLGKCVHKKPFYIGSGVALKSALIKYGRQLFDKEILFEFETKEEAAIKERELSILWDVVNDPIWYNMKPGGDGGSLKGTKRTEETKKRNSESNKGRIPWNKGLIDDPRIKHSDQWKKNHSSKLKGKQKGRKGSEHTSAKAVVFVDLNGIEYHVIGVNQFCRNNNLDVNVYRGRLFRKQKDLRTDKHPWKVYYEEEMVL